jgi:hypothetical protein
LVVMLLGCGSVPPVVEPHDAGEDAGQTDDAGRDGGADAGHDAGVDAGVPDAGPACAGNTDAECGASCVACSGVEHCMGGVCRYYNRLRFAYATKPPDAGAVCTFNLSCDETRDFDIPRALGIVALYRDAGCASQTIAGDGVTVADLYRIDCGEPFCRPFNPSSNCCRTITPYAGDGACSWSPP